MARDNISNRDDNYDDSTNQEGIHISTDKFINNDDLNIDTLKEQVEEILMEDRQGMNGDLKSGSNVNSNQENNKPIDSNKSMFQGLQKKLKDSWQAYLNLSGSNFIFPILFLVGTIFYLEITLHLLLYRSLDNKVIFPILLGIPYAIIIGILTGLFYAKLNKVLLWVVTAAICFLFNVQLIYFSIFKVYFSFQSLGMASDAVTNFGEQIIISVKQNIAGVFLLIIPIIILAFITKQMDYKRRGIKEQLILLGSAGVVQIIAMLMLLTFGKADYSPYDLYFNSKVPDLAGEQLGLTTMTRMDLSRIFYDQEGLDLDGSVVQLPTPTPKPTKAPVNPNDVTPVADPTPTPIPIDTSPNVMDIDFNALAAAEDNDTIKSLHEYFANVTPTNKNEYTGMFEGYNLIMLTAEGFSMHAISKEKTPTLYKLTHEGFVFNDFYTALWQTSTSDGEFVAMNGIIPIGTRSMYHGRNNLWPFSLGNQFDLLGVKSKAYHAHTYDYYQRDLTHPNLGYVYKGKGNGLVLENPDIWPESDLEMINASVDEYINEDRFHVYYMTVSGHMNYSFTGNMMSYKNRELVADLPYSDDVKAYISCQIELDKALAQLIKKLEEAGVADKTVIALSADHYPYGWEKEKYDELAGHEIEPNFEIYRNSFILWTPSMKETVVIDEPCSSMDILPTLSNLFGLEYDSRLLMGQDILSDAPPLVVLSNRSYITDLVKYNSSTGEVIKLTDDPLPENYIENMTKIVKNKFTVSEKILSKNYYSYVFPDYPKLDVWKTNK